MKRKILLICVSFSLAVVGLWLLTSGLARAADQHLGLRPTDNPLGVPGAVLTPTLRLVGGPGGETLFSSPVFCVHVSEPLSCSLYVRNPLTRTISIVAERVEISSTDGASVPALLGLLPFSQTAAAGEMVTFTLSLIEGWLPAGTYSGTLELSVEGTQPATEQFVLLVSPWSAKLEWAQEEFVYVADETHTKATVWVVARLGNAKDIQAELATLTGGDNVTVPFKTTGFLSTIITPSLTLTKDTVSKVTLNFTPTQLPTPGTYNGELQLSASNAAPITAPFTLVIPDRARGSYQLVVAELGQTPAVTTALTLTTALQFTGVRWLPASTSAASWWPVVAAALLFGVGLAVLTGYTVWGLAGPAPKAEVKVEGWWPKVRQWLQKAWAWVRGHPKVSLGLMAGTLALIVLVLSLLFDLTQAHVGDRNLLIWEAEGRGPVREVTVFGGEVVNQVGDWGQIRLGNHAREIAAQDVLTVPVTGIQSLSQPGVYQGSILVQSPDIAGGLVKVPVQVTVHDFIFWPALVILLGVVAGGWVKYLQDMVGGRLEQRKKLQEAWSQWNVHLDRDPYGETEGRINPLYTRIRTRINVTEQLLGLEPDWGIEAALETVTNVGKDFKDYSTLVDRFTLLKEEMRSLDVSVAEATFQRARPILDLFLAEREKLKQCLPDKQRELEQLEEAIEAVPQGLSLEPRDHVKSESDALEKELRNGELSEAQQRWHRAFELGLKVNLAALRQCMNTWSQGDLERLKPAEDQLASVDEYLKKVTESPELYAEAWCPLIQAQAVFEAEKAERLADQVNGFMKAARELEDAKREKREAIPIETTKLFAHVPMLLRGKEVYAWEMLDFLVSRPTSFPRERVEPAIAVQESEPYLWSDIRERKATCKLTFQVRGFDRAPVLDARPVERGTNVPAGEVESQTQREGFWEFQVKFTLPEDTWRGDPVAYVVEAKCGDKQVAKKTIAIRSPYTIELPLRKGDIVAGEWLFCEAIFKGPDPKEARKKHCYFTWEFNGSSLEPKETPSGRFWVPFDYAGRSARIQLRVLSKDKNPLLQKALFEGRVQEPIVIGLYRDKRRHNFNRRLAAGLLALVGGMAAQRVFGLTFGSFEEYLGAFVWGVGAATGIDPVTNGYKGLKDKVQGLLKLGSKSEQPSSSQTGQPA